MGVFSNPFKTLSKKLKGFFNSRDKALQEAEKSQVLIDAAVTKDQRIKEGITGSYKVRHVVGIRYFGNFSKIKPFRSAFGEHKRTPSIVR
jgi:hypothetical protein